MKYITLLFILLVPLKAFSFSPNVHDILFNVHHKVKTKKNIIPAIKNGYYKWKGVRYKYGGTDSSGIDCSALTQELAEELNVHLPRTTRQQIHAGKTVSQNELAAGDLVFFQTSETTLHVGMYLEEGRFIHASTRNGVTISSLDNDYWKERYSKGIRVIA